MPAPETNAVPAGKTAAVIGGGPAGLIAAEMLAQSGVASPSTTRWRRSAASSCWPDAAASTSPIAKTCRFPDPLWRDRAATAASDRDLSAVGAARLVRRSWTDDLRRLKRPGISDDVQDLAAVARLAAPPRRSQSDIRAAPSLDRLGRRRTICASFMHGNDVLVQPGCHRAGARRRELAEARLGRALDRISGRARHRHCAAAAEQLRLHRRLDREIPQLRRHAAQAHRRQLRRPHRARRIDRHPRRTGRRRDLCVVGAVARRDR